MVGKKMKIPKGALTLQTGGMGEVEFGLDDQKPKLNMVIYSGGIIEHWYWDQLVMDLSGAKFPKKKYPILQDHVTSLQIGYHNGKPICDDNLRFDPDRVVFVSTEESEKFQKVSAEGFPFEASARVRPRNIERVAKGGNAEANGIKLSGPATIFRKWDFIEGSVCTFGADRQTSSAVFSDKEEIEIFCGEEGSLSQNQSTQDEEDIMDITELKEKYPELYAQIEALGVTKGTTEAAAEFKKETAAEGANDAVLGAITELKELVQSQGKTIEAQNEKILSFDKAEDIRAEKELAASADAIWNEKLAASSIREERFMKIKKHVTYAAFVEEGKLDVEKFAEAVDAEVKEWEGVENNGSEILGFSYSSKEDAQLDAAKLSKQEKEDDEIVDQYLRLAGDKEALKKATA